MVSPLHQVVSRAPPLSSAIAPVYTIFSRKQEDFTMAVHRISDAAEHALKKIIERTKDERKKSDIINELIVDYERGLSFEKSDRE